MLPQFYGVNIVSMKSQFSILLFCRYAYLIAIVNRITLIHYNDFPLIFILNLTWEISCT